MCACASWSGVRTEDSVTRGSVAVLAATGQNNSLAVEGGLHLNHTISLDHLVSSNSLLSTEAFALNASNNSLENERHSSDDSSTLYTSPRTDALPLPATSQTVLQQDVSRVIEYNRSLDGEKTSQHNESLTLNTSVSANSVSSTQASHVSTFKNSDSENEEQSVTESTPFSTNKSVEITSYATTPMDVTTAQNDDNKQDHGLTNVCDGTNGMFSTVLLFDCNPLIHSHVCVCVCVCCNSSPSFAGHPAAIPVQKEFRVHTVPSLGMTVTSPHSATGRP